MAVPDGIGNGDPETNRTGIIPGSVRCLVAASRRFKIRVIKIKEDKFNERESQGINVRLRR
jgi:hypothetical protein